MRKLHLSTLFFTAIILNVFIANATCQATEINFPSALVYKIFKGNQYVAEATLTFNKKGSKRNEYQTHTMKLYNFEGLGFSKDEILLTDIYKTDLSVYSSILVKKGSKKPVFEAKAVDTNGGIMSDTQRVYRYKSKDKTGTLDTGLYSNYKVIDLLSSFIMASQMVRNKEKTKHFYFLLKQITKTVRMQSSKDEILQIEGKQVDVTPVSLQYQAKGGDYDDILTFYIHKERYYPIQVTTLVNGSMVTLRTH